jgi:hypothetical protein
VIAKEVGTLMLVCDARRILARHRCRSCSAGARCRRPEQTPHRSSTGSFTRQDFPQTRLSMLRATQFSGRPDSSL